MTPAILFICTGNICRSPMAERLLIARTRPGSVASSSAGTYGLTGHAMDKQAGVVARDLGADPEGHEAREITAPMIEAADLILGATEEHRDHVLRMVPRAMRRTFTLREFVRLAAELPSVRPSPGGRDHGARIAQVAARRGIAEVAGPGGDDIGDPYGGTLDGMRACGTQIAGLIDETIRVLGLQDPSV